MSFTWDPLGPSAADTPQWHYGTMHRVEIDAWADKCLCPTDPLSGLVPCRTPLAHVLWTPSLALLPLALIYRAHFGSLLISDSDVGWEGGGSGTQRNRREGITSMVAMIPPKLNPRHLSWISS